ncbi:MAG TPA: hypothetical protein VGA27_15470 [Candidatus Binatia bacterium]
MQTNERFHRPIGARTSRDATPDGVPSMSHFGTHDFADDYQGHQEHGADRAQIVSQDKHLSRFRNFNWQFLAFWTAYAAVIFAVGYALI